MRLSQTLFGVTFHNPVLLAAGTCGFGEELEDALDLPSLGGIVTKSVTLEPRAGNPAPRVVEAGNAMLNSVGLANPGLVRVCSEKLPWLRDNLSGIQVFVSVAGHTPDEYWRIVEGLESVGGFLGYELNLSCPNDTRLGGLPFALDPEALRGVVEGARRLTDRPLLVKLAPNVPDIGPVAEAAEEAGADGLTFVNTMPGLIIDIESRSAALGSGSGGLSGPALRAVGGARRPSGAGVHVHSSPWSRWNHGGWGCASVSFGGCLPRSGRYCHLRRSEDRSEGGEGDRPVRGEDGSRGHSGLDRSVPGSGSSRERLWRARLTWLR